MKTTDFFDPECLPPSVGFFASRILVSETTSGDWNLPRLPCTCVPSDAIALLSRALDVRTWFLFPRSPPSRASSPEAPPPRCRSWRAHCPEPRFPAARPSRVTFLETGACRRVLQITTTYEHDPRAVDPCARKDRNPSASRMNARSRGFHAGRPNLSVTVLARVSLRRGLPCDRRAPIRLAFASRRPLPAALRPWAERPSEGLG